MNSNIKSEQEGFLKLIIIIVIALLLMKYFHITFNDVVNWFKGVLKGIS